MDLPVFRYHPDPVRSGSVAPSTKVCRCCKQARGYIYTASTYARTELEEALCPWCIADGSAHKKFKAHFHDFEALSEDIPEEVADEIAERTPGFAAWQSPTWPACCDDAPQFIAPIGYKEIQGEYRDSGNVEMMVLNHIIYDLGISGGAALRKLESLNKDSGPTAYLWKCPKCLKYHVQIDSP